MNCFYLNPFYSALTFLYFYSITNFYSHSRHCYYGYFFIIVFVIVIAIIISSFSMLLIFIFLVFTILFYLCVYRIFLNLKQMTWPNIVQNWQERHWYCNRVFNRNFEHCLLNLFFWRSSFEVILLYFALDNYFFYSASIF